jgi:hypothetical protein
MKYYKPMGWRNESYRHSLAARGIKTNSFATRGDGFIMSDIPTRDIKLGIRRSTDKWDKRNQ